jgi:hypothetical protein
MHVNVINIRRVTREMRSDTYVVQRLMLHSCPILTKFKFCQQRLVTFHSDKFDAQKFRDFSSSYKREEKCDETKMCIFISRFGTAKLDEIFGLKAKVFIFLGHLLHYRQKFLLCLGQTFVYFLFFGSRVFARCAR